MWQLSSGMMAIIALNKSMVVRDKSALAINRAANKHTANKGLNTPFFGNYVPDNLNDMSVKQSMLNFKVVGILLATRKEDSQVIIHIANGRSQTYRAGDTLPGEVVIKRITAKGVLVERKGELESLSLPENELIFEVPAKPLEEDK